MDGLTTEQLALARRIVDQESERGASVGEAASAAVQKLRKCLGQIFSELGSEALLKRALHLASIDFPVLVQVDGSESNDALCPALDGTTPAQAREAAEAIFGSVVALLTRFVGYDLMMHVIGEVWPQIILGVSLADAHEEHV